MERRTMRGRLLVGLAASVGAALVPWLAAPGPATVEASEAPAGMQATPASASGSRWSEFDLPPDRTVLEGPDAIINMPPGVDGPAPAVETAAAKPSPGAPMSAAHPAGQAGPLPPGLPPHTLRGAMGYRLPLVSRQQVPDQVVSGVLIPAHTTYVILQPGYWELVGLSPDEANVPQAAAEKTKADEPAVRSEPLTRGWNPFRMFRRNRTPANGE